MTTDEIRRQFAALMADPDPEPVLRQRYSGLIAWIADRVSLVDYMRDSGIDLHPITTNIWTGTGCPCCGSGPVYVSAGR